MIYFLGGANQWFYK